MEDLIAGVSGYAVEALASVLVVLAGIVAGWFKLKIDEQMKERIRKGAVLAVGYAEEKGRQYLQETGDKMPGFESARIAAERLVATVPRVSREEATQIVESVLPYAREAMAAGASNLGKALRSQSTAPDPVQLKELGEKMLER